MGEHISHVHEDAYLRNLVAHARCGIVLSWAALRQAGAGHVNCHSQDYLVRRFHELGYGLNGELTRLMRGRHAAGDRDFGRAMNESLRQDLAGLQAIGESQFHGWFRTTIHVFERWTRPSRCSTGAWHRAAMRAAPRWEP